MEVLLITNGTYKIQLYEDSEASITSYHFFRQDSDGNWSSKVASIPEYYIPGYPVRTVDNNNPVDPYVYTSTFDTTYDFFAGCFEVKKSS